MPFPFPGDLPNPEIEPGFLALQADSLSFEPSRKVPKICSSVHGTLQAGILEWVILFLPPGDPPVTEIEPRSPALQADSLLSEPPGNNLEVLFKGTF